MKKTCGNLLRNDVCPTEPVRVDCSAPQVTSDMNLRRRDLDLGSNGRSAQDPQLGATAYLHLASTRIVTRLEFTRTKVVATVELPVDVSLADGDEWFRIKHEQLSSKLRAVEGQGVLDERPVAPRRDQYVASIPGMGGR